LNKSPQILRGSFSSVWTATIARVGEFFELYKICIPLHRSDRKISAKKRPHVCSIAYGIFNRFSFFHLNFAIFLTKIDELLSEFREQIRKVMKYVKIAIKFFIFPNIIVEISGQCRVLHSVRLTKLIRLLSRGSTTSCAETVASRP